MTDFGRITDVQVKRARTGGGLIAWVSFIVDGCLRVDGVAVRRTLRGELILTWPSRKDSRGRLHPHVHPVSDILRIRLDAELMGHVRRLLPEEVA